MQGRASCPPKNKARRKNSMNIYDTANRLAYEMKNSEEYKNYKKQKEEIANQPELKEKLEKFEKERYEVQIAAISEGKQEIEKANELQNLYVELIANEKMKQYFDSELKFNIMLADVNKIISEAVEDVIK